MGIVIRQSIKTTLVIFTGAVLGALINYAYTFTLNKTELGFVTNFVYQAALIQIFTLAGTASLTQVYTQKYAEGDVRRKALISFSSLVILGATLVFTIAYFLLKDAIISRYQYHDRPLFEKYYWLTPGLVLCWSFMTLFDHYLMSQHKVAISAFMREVLLRILNFVFLGLYVFHVISLDQFIASFVATYLIPALVLLYLCYRTKGFGFTFNFSAFSKADYKGFIHFSWYHLLLVASMNIMGYLDMIMLAPLDKEGVASLAVYRLAVFIISIMAIPYRAISNASFAVLNRTHIEESKTQLAVLFDRLGNNILLVAVGMFALIACNLNNVVAIFPEGYEAIKPIVLILMIGKLIDMATGMNNELISISKYYKFNFRISALLVILAFSLMRYLIPIYGIYGAAWAGTIALAVFNISKMLFLWVKLNLQPFNKNSLLIITGGLLACGAGYIFPFFMHPVVDAILRSVIIAVSYAIFLLLTGASPDLKDYLQSIKANKRLF